ncbi:hypothetical protein CEXT_795041 [Caerostris extrusa]|uniref:Uncharacterized protein n=1 Tax=Caerostris extrusa TaxID=172846 RepID=A0AAV4SYJ7_CAEEX|nr:hypothetical protein CEXT_795041 [Caerostris extrusa]
MAALGHECANDLLEAQYPQQSYDKVDSSLKKNGFRNTGSGTRQTTVIARKQREGAQNHLTLGRRAPQLFHGKAKFSSLAQKADRTRNSEKRVFAPHSLESYQAPNSQL